MKLIANDCGARKGKTITNFPELEEALRAWVHEAVETLASSTDAETSHELRRWRRDEDGIFRESERLVKTWPRRAVANLKSLPTWRVVENVVRGNTALNSHLDTLVGTAQASSRIELERLGRIVLPRPDELDDVDAAFKRRYGLLDWFLAAHEFDYVVVWPLPGLLGIIDPIVLDTGIELDIMSDMEVEASLNTGIIRPMFPGDMVYGSDDGNPACLRYRYSLPKVIGEEPPKERSDEVQNLEVKLITIGDTLELIFALLFPDPVAMHGRVAMESRPTWGASYSFQEATVSRTRRLRRQQLDEQASVEMQRAWKVVANSGKLTRRKELAVALRRLRDQTRRENVDDELIDVMIAAEALYLSDLGNEELSFRLALRASAWGDPQDLGMSRRELFDLMRSAYRVRSAVVHGDAPKMKYLNVKGAAVSLAAFVQAIENVVRHGLQKALSQGTAKESWPPDWDGLTLPPGTSL